MGKKITINLDGEELYGVLEEMVEDAKQNLLDTFAGCVEDRISEVENGKYKSNVDALKEYVIALQGKIEDIQIKLDAEHVKNRETIRRVEQIEQKIKRIINVG